MNRKVHENDRSENGTIDDLTKDPDQTIRFERVNVSDGSQAMVGNFLKNDTVEVGKTISGKNPLDLVE